MILLTLLAVSYASAFQTITLDEFKARPIPAFAQRLEGQDLVDYLNIVQPFFKVCPIPVQALQQASINRLLMR
ncbi:hypothetical protein OESDEN_00631 [Oesophagostomum dentatum]|uniref:Uncharacterized protein n=1 Tax=Oesophagostomum dentatum TaxID=61180 RepID=A0A0B1TPA1_OESDE|nr:hypothetical protein OESDEN_00631 [Oesophagostomum dentatum]